MLPNPFGGVNTHLWRSEAYIVGIVPVIRPAYSPQPRNGKERVGRGLVVTQQKLLNHDAEAGNISLTEEARGDTDRMGVADDG